MAAVTATVETILVTFSIENWLSSSNRGDFDSCKSMRCLVLVPVPVEGLKASDEDVLEATVDKINTVAAFKALRVWRREYEVDRDC